MHNNMRREIFFVFDHLRSSTKETNVIQNMFQITNFKRMNLVSFRRLFFFFYVSSLDFIISDEVVINNAPQNI